MKWVLRCNQARRDAHRGVRAEMLPLFSGINVVDEQMGLAGCCPEPGCGGVIKLVHKPLNKFEHARYIRVTAICSSGVQADVDVDLFEITDELGPVNYALLEAHMNALFAGGRA